MSKTVCIGNCGKICYEMCYPSLEDDFCPECDCNGYEWDEIEKEYNV